MRTIKALGQTFETRPGESDFVYHRGDVSIAYHGFGLLHWEARLADPALVSKRCKTPSRALKDLEELRAKLPR